MEGADQGGTGGPPGSAERLPQCDIGLLRALCEGAPCPTAVIDLEGRILVTADLHARVFAGMSGRELVNRNVRDILPPEVVSYGLGQSAALASSGRGIVEIAMIHGMHARTAWTPVRVPGEGPAILVQSSMADPLSGAYYRGCGHAEVSVAVQHSPTPMLGALERLSVWQARLLRGLAGGMCLDRAAASMGVERAEASRRIDRIARTLGHDHADSLIAHAFAAGLHMFEPWYFELVIVAALEGAG